MPGRQAGIIDVVVVTGLEVQPDLAERIKGPSTCEQRGLAAARSLIPVSRGTFHTQHSSCQGKLEQPEADLKVI